MLEIVHLVYRQVIVVLTLKLPVSRKSCLPIFQLCNHVFPFEDDWGRGREGDVGGGFITDYIPM